LAILPVYKTTSTAALLREADLPDPGALLNSILQRAIARYAGLDAGHPIVCIADETGPKSKTRLYSILRNISTPAPERAYIEAPRPPLRMLPTHHEAYSPAPLQISVYSDGSQTGQGAGYRYVVYYGPILITQGFGPAGPKTEVYDAELMGAVEGLRATMNQSCI
jgi:hypothetical protein